MQDYTVRRIAQEASIYCEEVNPCADMDYSDLKIAEKNLKEVLRFVRMARIAQDCEIRGMNQMDQYGLPT
jgi:hypothetical protein